MLETVDCRVARTDDTREVEDGTILQRVHAAWPSIVSLSPATIQMHQSSDQHAWRRLSASGGVSGPMESKAVRCKDS